MNVIIIPPIMFKTLEQTGLFNLDMETGLSEGKIWIQAC